MPLIGKLVVCGVGLIGGSFALGLKLAEQVEEVISRAAAAEKQRREEAAIAQQRLHRGALVVDYSAKALAIFTDEPSDVSVLERIKAKRNSSLTYQGRKVAGWIFPKYRQAQLAAVMSL
mgnify:CR=1 FL=1